MNKKFFLLLQIFFFVYGNPVKRDGVIYQPPSEEVKPSDEVPVVLIKLASSSESESEGSELSDIPIEFPFQIARSIDEIFGLNRNVFKTEKPSDENTATCPNTDIVFNTEATTQKPTKLKKFNPVVMERKPREDKKFKNFNKSDRSVSMSTEKSKASVSVSAESRKILNNSSKLKEIRKENVKNNFGGSKKISYNEISQTSKEKGNFFEESFVLKQINGKPIQGTLTVENSNGDEVEKTLLIGKQDGTSEEKKNLEKIEESLTPAKSHILDVLMSPFRISYG